MNIKKPIIKLSQKETRLGVEAKKKTVKRNPAYSLSQIKKFDGKKIKTALQWERIRHGKDVKKISAMGIISSKGVKYEVIFIDRSSIYVFL